MMLKTLCRHRRALHKIPELGLDLPKTRAYVFEALQGMGAEISFAAQSGVLAFFDAGRERTVAFRSDMDALPIEEKSGAEFASEHPGRMHACGHDGHMALLLTFAGWVAEHLRELPNNVLLIFQPGEESGGGAKKIVESGALESHRVKRIFAAHVEPGLPMGAIASRPGAFMSQSSEIHAHAVGKSAHAGRWQEGADALMALSLFTVRLAEMEKSLPKDMPRLLKICQLRSGTATNVIADEGVLSGTMRAFSEEDFRLLREKVFQAARACEGETGAKIELRFTEGYPPLRNDPELYRMFHSATADMDSRLCEPNMLTEDFSFYLQKTPGLMFQLGLGTGVELHSPHFYMDERALLTGFEVFCRLAARP